ncbi:MAG: glycosyltransferase [Candidatus Dormibacteraeota bacterium]|nr:glycosyltransferase [Candidatus Dormibacteraeota bacterium]
MAAALRQLDPAVGIAMVDPIIGGGRPAVRRLASLYPTIIQRARPAWGAIYHASNTRPAFATLRATFGGEVRRAVEQGLREADPDVLLSVHPLVNHVAWSAIRRSGRRRGLMTVITDLVDVHRGWAFPRADLVVVATEEARQSVIELQVPAARVSLLGLPVDPRFRPARLGEKATLRRGLGLEERRPTILVSGGGEGSGRLLDQVRALARTPEPWQVIAVCGRNEAARRRLARSRLATPTIVLGFVDNMPELMRAADLLVTKAGPGAIAEALTTGLPLVLTSYLPGQETPNITFVVTRGIGVYVPHPDELPGVVGRVLGEGGAEASVMAARARAVALPGAGLDIARECVRLAAAYMAESHARR